MTRIFVGNLSFETTEAEVRTTFERYGFVASVQMPKDHGTGRSRGIAFVAMPRLEDADEAITRLHGSTLGGRRLEVNLARERAAAPPSRPANRFHLV